MGKQARLNAALKAAEQAEAEAVKPEVQDVTVPPVLTEAEAVVITKQADTLPASDPAPATQTADAGQGPKAKHGTDEVPAKLSWFDAGKHRAEETVSLDETAVKVTAGVRADLVRVLGSPDESWKSYYDGFRAIMLKRKEANKPTAALEVLCSRVNRILHSAKGNKSATVKALEDKTQSFTKMLKSLPKTTAGGRPEVATSTVKAEESPTIEKISNVGTLMQIIAGACDRMIALGKLHATPEQPLGGAFAIYIGTNVKDMLKIAQESYQGIYAKFNDGGIVKDPQGLLKELGLIEEKEVAAEPVKKSA